MWYCTVKYIQRFFPGPLIPGRVSIFFLLKPIILHQIKGIYLPFTEDKMMIVGLPHVLRNTHNRHTLAHMFWCWYTSNYIEIATVSTLKTQFHATQTTPAPTFSFEQTLFVSLSVSSSNFHYFSLLHRCEWTVVVRFHRSMPLAQQHYRATVPRTSWILVLALFLALQVKICSDKIALSIFCTECRCPGLFSHSLFICNLLFLAAALITWLRAQIHSNSVLAGLSIKGKWCFKLPACFLCGFFMFHINCFPVHFS